MAMLQSVVPKLRCSSPLRLAQTNSHQTHAMFLRLIEASDPHLSARLHDSRERKPFTVSGVAAPASMAADPNVALMHVSLLDDDLIGAFVARFLNPVPLEVRRGERTAAERWTASGAGGANKAPLQMIAGPRDAQNRHSCGDVPPTRYGRPGSVAGSAAHVFRNAASPPSSAPQSNAPQKRASKWVRIRCPTDSFQARCELCLHCSIDR